MARKGKVFNNFKRPKLLRKEISAGEAAFGAAFLLFVGLMTWWLAAQREAYDPGERDIAIELLVKDSVEDTLYQTPVQPWRDPALGPAGVSQGPPNLGPFPPALLEGGWQAGRVETFTDENLYEKINGQAEQYRKFGFQRLSFVTIEREGLAMDLYLYDQGTFANALGLYGEQRGDRPVESQGAVHFTPNALGASGMVGRYVFHLLGAQEDAETAAKGRQLALALSVLAGESQRPASFVLLHEGLGLPLGKIGYTAINAFQFDFAKEFWFGQQDGEQRVFVHAAASADDAQDLFKRFHTEQLEEFEVVEESYLQALYRHKFLNTYFALRADGPMIYGLEGAQSKDAIPPELERLKSALHPDDAGEEEH